MDAGGLISDDIIIALVKDRLQRGDCKAGYLFDGFPRTTVQVECLKMLYEKMTQLWREFYGTPLGIHFRQPVVQIVVLFVDARAELGAPVEEGLADRPLPLSA